MNLLSLASNYGKSVQNTTERLLKENMYDFVGTDAHNFTQLASLKKIATLKNKKLLDSILRKNKIIFNH
jgi:tyrosine-protein phosphatase YwqE